MVETLGGRHSQRVRRCNGASLVVLDFLIGHPFWSRDLVGTCVDAVRLEHGPVFPPQSELWRSNARGRGQLESAN